MSNSRASRDEKDEHNQEEGFSVEMASKEHVRSLIVSDESQGKVLF